MTDRSLHHPFRILNSSRNGSRRVLIADTDELGRAHKMIAAARAEPSSFPEWNAHWSVLEPQFLGPVRAHHLRAALGTLLRTAAPTLMLVHRWNLGLADALARDEIREWMYTPLAVRIPADEALPVGVALGNHIWGRSPWSAHENLERIQRPGSFQGRLSALRQSLAKAWLRERDALDLPATAFPELVSAEAGDQVTLACCARMSERNRQQLPAAHPLLLLSAFQDELFDRETHAVLDLPGALDKVAVSTGARAIGGRGAAPGLRWKQSRKAVWGPFPAPGHGRIPGLTLVNAVLSLLNRSADPPFLGRIHDAVVTERPITEVVDSLIFRLPETRTLAQWRLYTATEEI